MDKFKEIRPIVLGIIKYDNKVLVMEGFDPIKNLHYYRALGGGVEFLETLEDALKREMKEELNVDIEIVKYLEFVDNIFIYKGKNAHEHMFLYEVKILNEYKDIYEFDEVNNEGKVIHNKAVWVDIEDLKNGSKTIFPEVTLKYI